MIYQCRCLTERGTQCPNTARQDLYCGKHSLPPLPVPDASREIISVSQVGHRLTVLGYCQGRAEYCLIFLQAAPPGGNTLAADAVGNKLASDARHSKGWNIVLP
jgi:hypothetical protein